MPDTPQASSARPAPDAASAQVEIAPLPEGRLRIVLRHSLLVSNLFPVREAIYRALESARPSQVEIDLSAVPHVDSSGLRMFVDINRATRHIGGALTLTHPTRVVLRALQNVRLDTVLTIRQSPAESDASK